MPLLDKDGTTIALVNTANVNALPQTTVTYDPSGVSTVSGLANSFPFLYQGLEHEVSDPGQLYFEPSGNVYNPQLQRELSLVGPQGIGGAPSDGGGSATSGSGNSRGRSGSPGGPSKLSTALSDIAVVGGAVAGAESLNSPFGFLTFGGSEGPSISLPIPFLGGLCLFNCGHSNNEQPEPRPHETAETYEILGIRIINGQRSAAGEIVPVGFFIPFIPEDPADTNFHPGPGWVKKGNNWKNDSTKQRLHADPKKDHPPYGPHFDWQYKKGLRLRIRRRGSIYQFWDKDIGQEGGEWSDFGFDVFPLP